LYDDYYNKIFFCKLKLCNVFSSDCLSFISGIYFIYDSFINYINVN